MPTPIEQAREMFPNVPEEIFEIFLNDFIDSSTWQFTSIYDDTYGTPWFELLGDLSLFEFSQLRWKTSEIFICENILDPSSKLDIFTLILDHAGNVETSMRRNVRDSKERFERHKKIIERTGSLCAPIMCTRVSGFLRVIDGNHRIAALFSLGLNSVIPVEVWLGE